MSKITIDRAVVEQALDALSFLVATHTRSPGTVARDALRAALDQPQVEQEPVAYRYRWGEYERWRYASKDPSRFGHEGLESEPIYTHPQPRQPLTDEQEAAAFDAWWRTKQLETFPEDFDKSRLERWGAAYKVDAKKAWLARAAIDAHGIGGEK